MDSSFDLFNLTTNGSEIESENYVIEHDKLAKDYNPNIDFSDPANFVHFGLAQRYYTDAFNYVRTQYPYDGSLAEKLKWYNDTSYFDRYFFDNIYPRVNGYITFSYAGWGTRASVTPAGTGIPNTLEYIKFYGGPHAYTSGGYSFDKSNIYDSSLGRKNNLEFGQGNTVEFFLKKTAAEANTDKEVILDIANDKDVGHAEYARLCIVLDTNTQDFDIEYYVNNTGNTYASIGTSFAFSSSWVHWAFVFDPVNTQLVVYKNGLVDVTLTITDPGDSCVRDIVGFIGAYQKASNLDNNGVIGAGKLSAGLDEFRFWKVVRTDKEIYRNHNVCVGGGSNTDEANTDLGVYFKFNEGIVGASGFDANILDYSGRISNGVWYGYCGGRSEDSAIVDGNFAATEWKDPVLYEGYPDYVSLYSEYEKIGKVYDNINDKSVWRMIPRKLRNNDPEKNLEIISQLIGSLFDTLYIQIKFIKEHRNIDYKDALSGNNPYIVKLLSGAGLEVDNILQYANIIEEYFNKNDEVIYEEQLYKIRNILYTNIYKNINNILKQKGTLNSYRNLIRCFGIDEDVLKMKMYSDGREFDLSEVKSFLSEKKKKFVSFASADNSSASIYGYSPLIATDERDFVPDTAGTDNSYRTPVTFECDAIFPYQAELSSFTKSSIFGMHEDSGLGVWDVTDYAMFQVYAERHPTLSDFTRFVLESTGLDIPAIETDYYPNVYNGTYWNFAVRLIQNNEDISVTPTPDDYRIEFYGVQVEHATIKNYFSFNDTVSTLTRAQEFLRRPKRMYVGAHRQDWTGRVLNYSDVMIGNLRFYLDYLDDDAINAHALNPINFGVNGPAHAGYLGQAFDGLYRPLPQMASLVFNWGFDTNQTLSSTTIPVVYDISGGNLSELGRYEGWIDDIVAYKYPATGFDFVDNDPENVYYVGRFSVDAPILPDELAGYGMVDSKEYYETEYFSKTIFASRLVYVLEKSIYNVISQQMLRFLSSLENYGELWGQGVDRYRTNYKRLDLVKHLFFDRVLNNVEVEKFQNYYKWIDSSIGKFVEQMIPAIDHYLGEWEVIESHVFERNKYESKYPLFKEQREADIEGQMLSGELWYDWEHGHAPLSGAGWTNRNGVWWKRRAERDIASISSGIVAVDNDREDIKEVVEQVSRYVPQTFYSIEGGTTYEGRAFALRSLGTVSKLCIDFEEEIHGGINYPAEKRVFMGNYQTATDGVMTLYTDGYLDQVCTDDDNVIVKKQIHVGKFSGSNSLGANAYCSDSICMPGNFFIDTSDDVYLTNIHHNSYLDGGEEPIQNTAIEYGGYAYRKQLKTDQTYIAPDTTQNVFDEGYIFYLDTPDDNWICDKVLSNKRITGWVPEDISRPVTIQNKKAV